MREDGGGVYDEFLSMICGDPTARHYLYRNESLWDLFLWRYPVMDREYIKFQIYNKAPLLGMKALIDYQRGTAEKEGMIKDDLKYGRGLVIVIAGRKGGGKSATAWLLLEWAHEMGRECCYSGIPQMAAPEWAKYVPDPLNIPIGAVGYIAETAIIFPSRRSMAADQRDALSILFSLRHGGRIIIAETQAMRALDIQFLRTMDRLVLKPEPMINLDSKDPTRMVIEHIKPFNERGTLYYARGWFTMLDDTPLPSFWTEELSTPCKPITDEKKAIDYFAFLMNFHGLSFPMAQRVLTALNFPRNKEWWQNVVRYEEGPLSPSTPEELQEMPTMPIISEKIPVKNAEKREKFVEEAFALG